MKTNDLCKEFITYVGFNILGMIGSSCYILADTFFIAKAMGSDGLAALNFCISVFSILQGFGLMIGIGGATRYSISKGNKENKEADGIFTSAVLLGFIVSLVFLTAGIFFAGSISTLLGADAQTLPLAEEYLRTILCFAPCFLLNNILIAFIRNDNHPRLSMTAMLVSSFSNIILDYVLIFPLGLGMFGAAFATGLSPVISIGILSTHFFRKRNGFRLRRGTAAVKKMTGIALLGVSSFVGELSSAIALITFNLVILKIEGTIGVAAYGVVANIALIAVAIFTGTAQGLQPLASKYYGEGKRRQSVCVYRYAIVTALGLAALIYGVVFAAKIPIVNLFNDQQDQRLFGLAVEGMELYFAGFFFAGVNIVTAAFLSAMEKAKEAFFISIMRSLFLLVPFVFVMSHLLGMTGVWLSFVGTEIVVCIISLICGSRVCAKGK